MAIFVGGVARTAVRFGAMRFWSEFMPQIVRPIRRRATHCLRVTRSEGGGTCERSGYEARGRKGKRKNYPNGYKEIFYGINFLKIVQGE